MKNYSDRSKFLFYGYDFDQQQKRMLQREKLREELDKEFSEIFNTE